MDNMMGYKKIKKLEERDIKIEDASDIACAAITAMITVGFIYFITIIGG